MKIVIAPDSLKECLPAPEAAAAIERGVRRAAPEAEVVAVPLADGGEGTVRALVEATGGQYRSETVDDPLGRPVAARWGICGDGRTAVIEMAEASGLERLEPRERDPMRTSTSGTGQLIRCALGEEADTIIVGIGGSATVDGGTGMAAALGARFLDSGGRPIERPCGGRLAEIAEVDMDGFDPRAKGVQVIVASDVTNPLTGPRGAARLYGPQKGATPEQVEELERGLANLARVVRECLGRDVMDLPGAGAAGGLGAGLVAFLGAELRSGVETVVEVVGLREKARDADLLITAEGRLDAQSAFGKAPAGVAEVARELGRPVVALAGALGPGCDDLYEQGLTAAFCIADRPLEPATAIAEAERLLERAAESVTRLWLAGRGGADART